MAEFVMNGCAVNADGHLTLDGVDTVEMAKKYGTPLYLLSEDTVRSNCRTYVNAVRENFGEDSYPCFASKALSFKGIYSIVGDEGMGSDAVSAGELYTANAAGFDMSRVFFHGNNKTEADMRYAIEVGTGWFVVDNTDELDSLDRVAGEMGVKQKVLLRITPGIDPHTHQAIATGKVDSKFGSAIATGQAAEIVKSALSKENLELHGARYGVVDGDYVTVDVAGEKKTRFYDVQVRVSDAFVLEMHVDTDDANAAALANGSLVSIVKE